MFRIEPYGNRPIVMDLDLHHGPKLASGDFSDPQFGQLMRQSVTERLGDAGLGSVNEAGPAATPGVGVQGELGYHKGLAFDVKKAEIKLALIVVEDTQTGNLFGKFTCDRLGVTLPDTQQNDQSLPDLTDHTSGDSDRPVCDPLKQCPHAL